MRRRARHRGIALLCALSALGCKDTQPTSPAPIAGQTAGNAAAAGQAGTSGGGAGTSSGAGAGGAAAPVTCGGVTCSVPAMLMGTPLDVRPCCVNNLCGAHVVGDAVFPDQCVALMGSSGETNSDCPSRFDEAQWIYRFGCCLADSTCGEMWSNSGQFGCGDPRSQGRPAGGPCNPAHSCKALGKPCAAVSECCDFENRDVVCAAFPGSAATSCAQACQVDMDCPQLCCLPTQTGAKACAPPEACNTR